MVANDNRPDGRRHVRQGQADVRAAACTPYADVVPDLGQIAREPGYLARRDKLAQAMTANHGVAPGKWMLDHQMIATGLAAGHGGGACRDRPLGSALEDPAVVVGLVLHYAKRSGRHGLPIPKALLNRLDDQVACGSAAARLIRDWLDARSVPCGTRRLWLHDGGRT